jgi:hypothetical protein
MRNKINVIDKIILSIFVAFIILNMSACGNNTSEMKKAGEPNFQADKYNDDLRLNGNHICPFCKGNYRSFYTLPNKPGSTVLLLCIGCLKIWLNPENIELDGASLRKQLEALFDKEFKQILKAANAHWSTREEVANSEWKEVMGQNPLLLYDSDK